MITCFLGSNAPPEIFLLRNVDESTFPVHDTIDQHGVPKTYVILFDLFGATRCNCPLWRQRAQGSSSGSWKMTASSPDMVACCLILLKVVFFYPIACIGVGILLVITYRLFFHPLSSIPGPRLAGVSNVWYANEAKNGRMAILGKNLHRNYGPVIRVGPDEVWFNSKSAFKTIYSELRPVLFCMNELIVNGTG